MTKRMFFEIFSVSLYSIGASKAVFPALFLARKWEQTVIGVLAQTTEIKPKHKQYYNNKG